MPDGELDKTQISIVPLDQSGHDREWWLARTPEVCFQDIEQQRQILNAYSEPAPDLKELLKLLDEHQIVYVLIGGMRLDIARTSARRRTCT